MLLLNREQASEIQIGGHQHAVFRLGQRHDLVVRKRIEFSLVKVCAIVPGTSKKLGGLGGKAHVQEQPHVQPACGR